MMTEDEARTKWCPFVRAREMSDDVASNRYWDGTMGPQHRCIASECMAWYSGGLKFTDEREGDTAKVGYCGLAWNT
jgi:hypothetical protein